MEKIRKSEYRDFAPKLGSFGIGTRKNIDYYKGSEKKGEIFEPTRVETVHMYTILSYMPEEDHSKW
jgi:hypothetical protein